jgi:hypothetical protein
LWKNGVQTEHWAFEVEYWLLNVEYSFFKRQFNGKPAAFAQLALHAYPAAVGLDDVFHDAQADSNTLRLAPQLGTAPVKPLENPPVFPRRNPRAVVGDGKIKG